MDDLPVGERVALARSRAANLAYGLERADEVLAVLAGAETDLGGADSRIVAPRRPASWSATAASTTS